MAAKIFAVTDHDIAELVKSYQESQRVRILEADLEVSG
jgi:phosphoribosylcarboxyaminoimidazole (NCAIR) mutase